MENSKYQFETIYVQQKRVACDGGGGAQLINVSGHPRVYLTIDAQTNNVVCPYCSRTYMLKDGAAHHHH
jgi:uncharacterized Zn-finger protein